MQGNILEFKGTILKSPREHLIEKKFSGVRLWCAILVIPHLEEREKWSNEVDCFLMDEIEDEGH